VRVVLSAAADGREVVLRISDSGVGFDAAATRGGRGLGLASMRERARLVGAELRVTSSPGAGATIEVRAPMNLTRGSSPAVPANAAAPSKEAP
jgi:signal transduction histidine kinase